MESYFRPVVRRVDRKTNVDLSVQNLRDQRRIPCSTRRTVGSGPNVDLVLGRNLRIAVENYIRV